MVIFYRVFLEILSRSAGPAYLFLQIVLVYFFNLNNFEFDKLQLFHEIGAIVF